MTDRPAAWFESRDNLVVLARELRKAEVLRNDRDTLQFFATPWRFASEWYRYLQGVPLTGDMPERSDPGPMTTEEAAKYLGVGIKTLHNWRSAGKGPKFFKVGGVVRYSKQQLDEWLQQRKG